MSAKGDLAALTEIAERQLDEVFRPLAPRLAESVRRHAIDGKTTHAARRAILRDVDALLKPLYGRQRGDLAAVGAIIEDGANRAYADPIAREGQRVAGLLRTRNETALLAALMRGGSTDGQRIG